MIRTWKISGHGRWGHQKKIDKHWHKKIPITSNWIPLLWRIMDPKKNPFKWYQPTSNFKQQDTKQSRIPESWWMERKYQRYKFWKLDHPFDNDELWMFCWSPTDPDIFGVVTWSRNESCHVPLHCCGDCSPIRELSKHRSLPSRWVRMIEASWYMAVCKQIYWRPKQQKAGRSLSLEDSHLQRWWVSGACCALQSSQGLNGDLTSHRKTYS